MITQEQANSFLKIAHANIKANNQAIPTPLLTSLSSLLIIEKDKTNKNDHFICETSRIFSLFVWSEFLPIFNEQKTLLLKKDNIQAVTDINEDVTPKLIRSMDEVLERLEEDLKYSKIAHEVSSTIHETCKPIIHAKVNYENYFELNRYNYRDIERPTINTSTIIDFDNSEMENKINFTEEDMPKFINIYTRYLMYQYYGDNYRFEENFVRLANTVVIAFSSLYSEVQLLKKYHRHLIKII